MEFPKPKDEKGTQQLTESNSCSVGLPTAKEGKNGRKEYVVNEQMCQALRPTCSVAMGFLLGRMGSASNIASSSISTSIEASFKCPPSTICINSNSEMTEFFSF